MSNEIEAVSFRLVDEDIKKFREIAKQQGLNQAEMFQGLMNSFEMSRAKGQITDRAKEIEIFQDTVNNLMGMFINSLAINQTSEERIRESLSLELNTKDKTIADLQGHKEKSKDLAKLNDEKIKESDKVSKELIVSLDKTTKELEQKDNIIANQQEQINTLNSIATEYKSYKDLYKDLEATNNTLTTEITNTLHAKADLESKILNTESMKEFYKSEVDGLKIEIKDLNTNIKEIDKNNKEELKTVERDHKEEIKIIEIASEEQLKELIANNKSEIVAINESIKAIEKVNKEEIKTIELAHKIELKELDTLSKSEMLSLKKELLASFKEELNEKLEFEKSKFKIELDSSINNEQSLK